MRKLFFLLWVFGLNALQAQLPADVRVAEIWSQGQHNAFTDLIRFKGNFYCTFREGSDHVPDRNGRGNGVVRILKSKDGRDWKSVAMLEKEGMDLRDPKFSITPQGRLMIIMGGSLYKNGVLEGRQPQLAFSNKKGTSFSNPEKAELDKASASWGDWIWRVIWHKGTAYGMNYQIGPKERHGPSTLQLWKSKDGHNFSKHAALSLDGFPNEATIRIDQKGDMYALIRRETLDAMGVWGKSSFPYTHWEYTPIAYRLGGPNFLFLDKSRVVMGTRVRRVEQAKLFEHTGIFKGDKKGHFEEVLKLPSAGDNSYPGMCVYKNKLWVSYYSSHTGRAKIYIAEIPLSYF